MQRWLLLMEFCALAFIQSSIFLIWNPIANSALFAFGPEWTPSTLAWQINLATITSPFIQYPVWMVLKKFNLRFCQHLNDMCMLLDTLVYQIEVHARL